MKQPDEGALLVVSACLLGRPCRYDAASKPAQAVLEETRRWEERGGRVVALCPEELGEMGTPRPPADLRGGDGHAVLDGRALVRRVTDQGDVTGPFLLGARRAAELSEGAERAILKARSPSCGVGLTEIDGEKRAGDGVFAAILRRRGVRVGTDENL